MSKQIQVCKQVASVFCYCIFERGILKPYNFKLKYVKQERVSRGFEMWQLADLS